MSELWTDKRTTVGEVSTITVETDSTIPASTSVTLTLYEDVGADGTGANADALGNAYDHSAAVTLTGGNGETNDLSGFDDGGNVNDYWLHVELDGDGTDPTVESPTLSSADLQMSTVDTGSTTQSANATAAVHGTAVETGQTAQQAAATSAAVATVVQPDATAQAAAATATIGADQQVQTGATAQAATATLTIGEEITGPPGGTVQTANAEATVSDTVVHRDVTSQAAAADAATTSVSVVPGATTQSATADASVGPGVQTQTSATSQQATASSSVYDGRVGSTTQTATGAASIGTEVLTEADRTIQRASADAYIDDLVIFTAVDWEQTTPHIPEPDHVIKTGSDRPDITFELAYDGTPVNLPDAVDATVELYAPEGTQIDHGGELGGRYPAVVTYDVDSDLFVGGGWYTAEIRVTFADGDEQWFPIERPTYDIAVYPSPYDRPEHIAGDDPFGYVDSAYGENEYGE